MSPFTVALRYTLLIFGVIPAVLGVRAYAQGTGTVRGVVASSAGQPVVGALVTLTTLGPTNDRHEIETDELGEFEQSGLSPGHYSITADRDDLGDQILRVLVHPGGTADVRFLLERGRTAAPWLRALQDNRFATAAFAAGVRANRAGDFETGIAQFQTALQATPTCVECYFNIGVSYSRLSRFKEAEAAYRTAIRIRADYATAYYGLADVFSKQGRTREATAARSEANRIAIQSLAATRARGQDMIRRARAFLTSGNVDDAVRQLEAALAADRTLFEAYYWLGRSQESNGALNAASRSYSLYLETTPAGEHADDARRRRAVLEP